MPDGEDEGRVAEVGVDRVGQHHHQPQHENMRDMTTIWARLLFFRYLDATFLNWTLFFLSVP